MYRVTGILGDDILKMTSASDIVRMFTTYQHRNKSQYFAWAKNRSDLTRLQQWMDAETVHIEEGEEFVNVFMSQHTSSGVDLGAVEKALIKRSIIDHHSRAAHINEVITPIVPPINLEEIVVYYNGDDMGDGQRYDEMAVFTPTQFKDIQRCIINSRTNTSANTPHQTKKSRYLPNS